MDFFAFMALCRHLDEAYSGAGGNRHTHLYVQSDHICLKVTHIRVENGKRIVLASACDIAEGSDLDVSIRDLHAILDDRVQYLRVVVEEDWQWDYDV